MNIILFIFLFSISLLSTSCTENIPVSQDEFAVGDAYYKSVEVEPVEETTGEVEIYNIPELPLETTVEVVYPDGPYSLELFNVIPNMSFYDPWTEQWVSLSDLYKDNKQKAVLLISSAGWCGPCLKEAAALIDVYDSYHPDGLEIIYTLGNTNFTWDTPFDTNIDDPQSASYKSDLEFMESWQTHFLHKN